MKPLEIVFAAGDESGKSDRSKVANSGLFRRGVLDDLGAKIRGLDRTEVLLIRFG